MFGFHLPNGVPELIAAAAKHRRPTLIIWGERDRVLPVDHLHSARRRLPHARTHLFGRIGHAADRVRERVRRRRIAIPRRRRSQRPTTPGCER